MIKKYMYLQAILEKEEHKNCLQQISLTVNI
jgi:hypothetical protein